MFTAGWWVWNLLEYDIVEVFLMKGTGATKDEALKLVVNFVAVQDLALQLRAWRNEDD